MSATVEFRQVHRRVDGQTINHWTEYRVREVVISENSVVLSAWSDWQRLDDAQAVDETGNLI